MTQFLLSGLNIWVVILMLAWVLPWKGVALWKAAKNNNIPWFIALLVVNTAGILEILYVFVLGNKKEEASSKTP